MLYKRHLILLVKQMMRSVGKKLSLEEFNSEIIKGAM